MGFTRSFIRGLLAGEYADAVQLYEISLRYYRLGLAWAGSAYAHHTVGSTICVHAAAYGAVGGVPNRQAAEDFYLLNKLRKLGPITALSGAPLALAGRPSTRVPFGTGPAIRSIMDSQDTFALYDPNAFVALRCFLIALEAYAKADEDAFASALRHPCRPDLSPLLQHAGHAHLKRFRRALKSATTATQRLRRLTEAFDGLRTLKFIHAVRDTAYADCAWR